MPVNYKSHVIILTILWLLVHVFLFEHYGIRTLLDSTAYLKRADYIIAHRRLEDAYYLFYIIPIGLIAFFRWLFPHHIIFYLFFQSILSGLAMMALYFASAKIFNARLAGLMSALLFLFWLDNIHWNITIMTESLLCSFICFIIFIMAHFKGSLKDYLLLSVMMIILVFTRPTGVVAIIGVIGFLLDYNRSTVRLKSMKFSIVAALLLIAFFSANMMFSNWDFTEQYRKGNIVTYMDLQQGMPLYHEHLRLLLSPDLKFADSNELPVMKIGLFIYHNPLYFLKTGSLKVWYLITGLRPYYSSIHNLYTTCWVILIYSLFYLGLKNTSKRSMKVFVFTVILINCALIAISSVDWDNRFYIPMEPGVALLAGGGAAYLLSFVKKNLIFRHELKKNID